jgi:membrane peptidoglycan carboxypeptidase
VNEKLGPRTKAKKKKGWPEGTQAALVSIDPNTGAVKAIYGGDGRTRFANAVTGDTAQAGSTFKPFTLVAALEGARRGADPTTSPPSLNEADNDGTLPDGTPLSLRSRFDGSSPQTFAGLEKPVRNSSGHNYGKIDLIKATQDSVNTVFVGLNVQVGSKNTKDVAVRAGVPEKTVTTGNNNVLGVDSPHPIDMASAYATFAAQGIYHKPHVVTQVRTPANGVICCKTPDAESRFDKGVIADATYAMQQVIRRGTGTYGRNLDRPAAGKTGTTDDNVSAWFVGFTPQLSTAVAMYRIDPKPPHSPVPLKGFQGVSDSGMVGGSLPLRVWTEFMSLALDGKPVKDLPDPVWGGEDQNPTPTTSSPSAADTQARPSTLPTEPTWTPPTSPTWTAPTNTDWPPDPTPTPTVPTAKPTNTKTKAPDSPGP